MVTDLTECVSVRIGRPDLCAGNAGVYDQCRLLKKVPTVSAGCVAVQTRTFVRIYGSGFGIMVKGVSW